MTEILDRLFKELTQDAKRIEKMRPQAVETSMQFIVTQVPRADSESLAKAETLIEEVEQGWVVFLDREGLANCMIGRPEALIRELEASEAQNYNPQSYDKEDILFKQKHHQIWVCTTDQLARLICWDWNIEQPDEAEHKK